MILLQALKVFILNSNVPDDENELKMMYYLHSCDIIHCQDCVNKAYELENIDMPVRCAIYRLMRTCTVLRVNENI